MMKNTLSGIKQVKQQRLHGTNIVEIPMGSKENRVNGEKVLMDTVAEVKNQRIFIPARYLAEGLGANVLLGSGRSDGSLYDELLGEPYCYENY